MNYPTNNKVIGQEIESFAADYLQKQGLLLLHRNFRCRLGEIDLIGIHQKELLFIEVRFRRNLYHGGAAASADFYKQQKLIKTAQFFLKSHPKFTNATCRFDVIAVTLKADQLSIEWIKNAFY